MQHHEETWRKSLDLVFAHVTLIQLLHYLGKCRSCSLAVYNNEFIRGSACVDYCNYRFNVVFTADDKQLSKSLRQLKSCSSHRFLEEFPHKNWARSRALKITRPTCFQTLANVELRKRVKARTERHKWTELNWHGLVFDELTNVPGVMHYSRHRLTASVAYVTVPMWPIGSSSLPCQKLNRVSSGQLRRSVRAFKGNVRTHVWQHDFKEGNNVK